MVQPPASRPPYKSVSFMGTALQALFAPGPYDNSEKPEQIKTLLHSKHLLLK
ncbi:hypothetical protein yrohd0001_8010 [Yersinia rohdei ATCC 43380]|nr:hypothetical protein yrohd0001_8010 [Yersinia rohdei ATCC 43380]